MVKTFKVKINFIDNTYVSKGLNQPYGINRMRASLSRHPIRFSCFFDYTFRKSDFGGVQRSYSPSKKGDTHYRQIRKDSILEWLNLNCGIVDIPISMHSVSPPSVRGCNVNLFEYRRDGRIYMVPTIITINGDSSEITTIIRDIKLGLVDEG